MRSVTKDVWLMTALMVVPIVAIEILGSTTSGRLEGFLIGNWLTMPLLAGVITAIAWSLLVTGRSSVAIWWGSLVGALCAMIILAIPTVVISLQLAHTPRRPDGGLVEAAGWFSMAVFWLVGVPLGALFGAITTGARRSWGTRSAAQAS